MKKTYKRILVANRGDSAVRVIRACKEMQIETVAIFSKVDRKSLHTRLADYSICIGGAEGKDSYQNSYNVLSAAIHYEVDAIHPGIGYFAEDPRFSELCKACNIDYIGPSSNCILQMGNKGIAKNIAKKLGIPVVGNESVTVNNFEDCFKSVKKIGYPIILKATGGGGGKGIRVVYKEEDLMRAFELCIKEMGNGYRKNGVLVESYIEDIKHIEVQVLADKFGNIVHLGDRECTIQSNNQKLIEESRSDALDKRIREKIYKTSIDICKYIGYVGVGTIEYILGKDNTLYFLEMNTRLQVEHTLSELITGVDLVKQQIKVAQGEQLNFQQEDIEFQGYGIQCRILAGDFSNGFIPDCGEITRFDMPGGFGVRIESAYELGNVVTSYYDPLLCKICCHDDNKTKAIKKMIRCLEEMRIEGVSTNKETLIDVLRDKRFTSGNYTTNFLKTKKADNNHQIVGE